MKPNTIVIYDPIPAPGFTDEYLPFPRGTRFLFTGEITNMEGHGVYWPIEGKARLPFFYHLENFRLPTGQEY